MSTPLLQQFPSLAAYPSEFLKDLLSSPALTEAFLFTLPEVQELSADVERLGRENEEIARRNLELRDELLALREATAQSYGHAEALKAQWAEIERVQASIYQKQRPSFLHLRLKHSISAQDDLSEKLAVAFIESRPLPATSSFGGSGEGRVDSPDQGSGRATPVASAGAGGSNGQKGIDEFINEFKAARKIYHKRAIWAERWTRGEVAWRDD